MTLDSDMGALFDWASEVPERARARELVALLRIGYALSTGKVGRAPSSAHASGESRPEVSGRGRDKGAARTSALQLESQGADSTLEIFDAASVTGVPPP